MTSNLAPLARFGVDVDALERAVLDGTMVPYSKDRIGGRTLRTVRDRIAAGETCPVIGCGVALATPAPGEDRGEDAAELAHIVPASEIAPGCRAGDRRGIIVTRRAIDAVGTAAMFVCCKRCNRVNGEARVTDLDHGRTLVWG